MALYYHVTFHDLQASNHLTMFPGPSAFLKQEIENRLSPRGPTNICCSTATTFGPTFIRWMSSGSCGTPVRLM